MNWIGYKNYDHYFWYKDRDKWMKEISEATILHTGPRNSYINIPAAFDIETSSFKDLGKKRATMYLWSLCVNGSTLLGRTWTQFLDVLKMLSVNFRTLSNNKLIIYVHNLGYEFQFMRKWMSWEEVFAVKDRRPIHAVSEFGIEFKCSYILSNYKLAYIGENLLRKYPVQKDVGALDYSKVRHSYTPLTEEEIWYSVHDVQVVTSYIQEKIENEGGIENIPLTNTGYVRQFCREACFTQDEVDTLFIRKRAAQYHETMKSLSITSQHEYITLHQAFAGGFTHAAPLHSGRLLK